MKEEINLVKICEIILRLWWVVLIFAVIGSLVAFSVSTFLITPQYTSTAKVYVSGSERVAGNNITMSDITLNQRLVGTYIEILCGNVFLQSVADEYNRKNPAATPAGAESIKSGIVMGAANETEILEIKYTDSDPKRAKAVLDALLNKAQGEITRVMEGCKVFPIEYASFPLSPSSPNVKQNTFIGLFVGIVLGIAVIFMRELFDTRIKDDEDLKNRYGIAVLGIIPNLDVD